jgi:atypical dual specificity phosphatase
MPPLVSKLIYWPTFWWNALLGRVLHVRNWWDRVDESIVLGAVPLRSDVEKLAGMGITGVVNTCDEYAGPQDLYATHHIEQLWIPTVDFQHPSLENVTAGVDFMHRHISEGGQIYVHCKAGRARSATIALCYLMAHQGMTAAEAQAHLLKARPHVNAKLPAREVVRQYAQAIKRQL